ncbi:MAG: T9SS type A sorting domain-containing protein [Williamsia sp.]|nr:T9SS type A sorting domain-containing protein [Williamsia sp.]
MHKFLPAAFCSLLVLLLHLSLSAQNFTAVYTFSGVVSGAGGKTDPTPVPTATGISFGSFHVVGNPNTNPNASGRFSFQGWPLTSTINLTEYYEVIITPQANYSLSLDTMTFTVQRSGTGISQFAVRSSADNYNSNLPASFGGSELTVEPGNIFKLVSTSTTTAIANCKIAFNLSNATTPDTIRFYGWGASAAGGTFSLNRVQFAGAASAAAGTPLLTLDTNALRFPSTPVGQTSAPLQYTIKGTSLSAPITVTSSGPYTISGAANGSYSTSLELAPEDVVSPKTVFVKFLPTAAGALSGTIANSSTGAATLNVSVNGQGIDPANLSFNFNTCTALGQPGGGFISYSVTGTQAFACSQFGNNSTNGVDINGYSGGAVENEDWLISSPLAIGGVATPILNFYSRVEFAGPILQLLVSTSYDGYSDPRNATWTDLQAAFPTVLNTWTLTDGINLSAYKSSPRLFIAFKYISSPELGAARWTLDDVNISDRSKLLSAGASALNFGEVSAGSNSASQTFSLQGFGYGDVTVSAPESYQLSLDNTAFSASVLVSAAALQNGTPVYIRFAPASKALKIEGRLRFTGSGLDSSIILLTGSSYPKAETFDVGAYNLSFFGSNSTNNPTPQKITTQIDNISTVFQHLNLDVVGVEEVSSDSAIGMLMSKLPGYGAVLSNRWSYSFNPPDPTFPPQKIGFIYNAATAQLVEQRVMMEGLFDSLRNNQATLPGYPDSASHFWSSGRLPFMATFDVSIGGKTKRVRVIDIHAKSASDVTSYNRRVYDVRVLKDTLDTYYKDDNIILLGDYNDRVAGSIYAGGVSPYRAFVTDTANYGAVTYPLDSAGKVSFISGTGLIDHIIISNELKKNYISNSTDIEDARTYISGYNANSASDHLPIFTRMTLVDQALPVKLSRFEAAAQGSQVLLNWKTDQETNNAYFIVERSADGRTFYPLGKVTGAGTSSVPHSYGLTDSLPLPGLNYYRLQQVDLDGKKTQSNTLLVKLGTQPAGPSLFPNPVKNYLSIQGGVALASYTARVSTLDGKLVAEAKGTISQINGILNQRVGSFQPGMYVISLQGAGSRSNLKFVKE